MRSLALIAFVLFLAFWFVCAHVGCTANPPASDPQIAANNAVTRAMVRGDLMGDEARRVISHAAGAVKDSGYRIQDLSQKQHVDLSDTAIALEQAQKNAAHLYGDAVKAQQHARDAEKQLAFERGLWLSYKIRMWSRWIIGGSLALLLVLGLAMDFLPAGALRAAATTLFGLLFSGVKGAVVICLAPFGALTKKLKGPTK